MKTTNDAVSVTSMDSGFQFVGKKGDVPMNRFLKSAVVLSTALTLALGSDMFAADDKAPSAAIAAAASAKPSAAADSKPAADKKP
ncbi:MAG TPA: hypothetical protein DC058_05840, partial [Planctomycetaceae bacterium]|nr:hypothetical protein [Planctomycetaceae bacterium]HBC60722.1 hypothetical protein [Planctomycetaceae bacterium]